MAVRAAATTLGLEFEPLASEPFVLTLPAAELGRAEALLSALSELGGTASEMGGYDLGGAGAASHV